METAGVVRKIDELGRIVIPLEFRRGLDIAEKDELNIRMDQRTIVIEKHIDGCIFCGSAADVFEGKRICKEHCEQIAKWGQDKK